MPQTEIPFHFMRGGTSRGPYFHARDLPDERALLSKVLVHAVGSGHPLNIDGVGGGAAVTTKVAILSAARDGWADVDYFFAQIGVEDKAVDFRPTCGNILAGVGPAAIEMGLIRPAGDVTDVKINAVNTGARVIARVRTPGGEVEYDGDTRIDGVPGTAAPIELMFMDVTGGATGAMFPTGARMDEIDGVTVTCMDVAMPMVIARAIDFGLSGTESAQELDANRAFYQRMEPIRIKAGARMGLGDVSGSVIPKFALIAPPAQGGHMLTRYFMPKNCHPGLAVTGSQCLATCLLAPGTVAEGILPTPLPSPAAVKLEHPMGILDVSLQYAHAGNDLDDPDNFTVKAAGLTRTARMLARGTLFIPRRVWSQP